MLVVCSTCQRHVREGEASCPFCKRALVALDVAPAPKPLRVAFAIAAATAAMGCGKTSEPAAVYGGPPVEMTDAAPAPTETVSPPAPAYGLPPPVVTEDAGTTSTTRDAGSPTRNTVRPLYGAPPSKR